MMWKQVHKIPYTQPNVFKSIKKAQDTNPTNEAHCQRGCADVILGRKKYDLRKVL